MVNDPVCGKEVNAQGIDEAETTAASGAPLTDPSYGTKRFYEGTWYYFCSLACRQRFIADPGRYLVDADKAT
jgi:YHS domain-containing protein